MEVLGLLALLAAGLGTRLAFVHLLPVLPISDFRALLDFALQMRDGSLTLGGFYWAALNPGLPLLLSPLLRIVPDSPEATARLATAVITGLLPAFPFLLWRGVLPLSIRLLAGGLLALWPGQIAFSGVLAQDNWVLFPTVALGALAVRSLALGRGSPVTAGLFYALGVSIRQELLVVLLPLLAAAGLASRQDGRWKKRLLLCLLATGIPLGLLALLRHQATGHFSLTTRHAGLSVLGAYVPGATANAWIDPIPYVASIEPELMRDPEELQRQGIRLTLREVARRPAFHAARIAILNLNFATAGEAASLYWSLLEPQVLPGSHHSRAQKAARL
ncbi:hypothetical protein EHM82_01385, partial [bacterium]